MNSGFLSHTSSEFLIDEKTRDINSSHIMFKGTECLDLDAAIGSEVINVDGSITKLLQGKDTVKYKVRVRALIFQDHID